MFFKILNFDFRNGTLSQWKKYLFTIFLFCLFSLYAWLFYRNLLLLNPSILKSNISVGDFFFYIFAGSQGLSFDGFEIMDAQLTFKLPSLWLIILIWLLYITLSYPFDELQGIGKHLLVVHKKREYWLFSKFIWTLASSALYCLIGFLTILINAVCYGADLSFNVSYYLPYDYAENLYFIAAPPYDFSALLPVILMCMCALCVIQFLLSLFLKPVMSFLLMLVYIFASMYVIHPLFVANYSMAIRNSIFVSNGLSLLSGYLVLSFIIVLSLLTAYLKFSRMDILN